MKDECCFCAQLATGLRPLGERPWDEVLLETSHFVVLPTVGALVPGWVLVIPKRHYLCIGALEDHLWPELQEVCRVVSRAVVACYRAAVVAEHGPAVVNQPVGCGVDHAHLHVFPTELDLRAGVDQLFPGLLRWGAINGIEDTARFHDRRRPYLYLEQPAGEAHISTHPRLPSQVFRKVVAAHSGRAEQYDWRAFPEEHNVESTARTLGRYFSEQGRRATAAPSARHEW